MESSYENAAREPEPDNARIRAMYKLALAAPPKSTLLLAPAMTAPRVLGDSWPGDVVTVPLTAGLNFGIDPQSGPYDLAVLHWGLDFLAPSQGKARRAAQLALLRSVRELMAPGGVIAGCVDNRFRLKRSWQTNSANYTPATCKRLLESAGIANVQIFLALPSAATPHALVSMDPAAYRQYFEDTLAATQHELGIAAYLLRRLLAATGAYRYLVGSILFWGSRPC